MDFLHLTLYDRNNGTADTRTGFTFRLMEIPIIMMDSGMKAGKAVMSL